MPGYAGLVALASAIDKTIVSKNSSSVPVDGDALPSYRVYGPSGFLSSGTLAYKDTGVITGATNANPTVITSVGHGLITGVQVTIASIGGNTGANGTFSVTVLDSNTFSIPVDTSGGSAYTSGGTWHATGVLDWSFTPTVGANYASGVIYSVVIYGKFSGVVQIIDDFCFQVT